MRVTLAFTLGTGFGLVAGLVAAQLSAVDVALADEEIARLVKQLEDLERSNAELGEWVANAQALPAELVLPEQAPLEEDDDDAEEGAAEVDAGAGGDAEGADAGSGDAMVDAVDAAPPDAPTGDRPDIEDMLGALLEAEAKERGDSAPGWTAEAPKPTPAEAAPTKPPTEAVSVPPPPKAAEAKAAAAPKPAATTSASRPASWPSDAPKQLSPTAVDASVRAAVSGVGELVAIDCSAFPCVVAVQAADPELPCCGSLQSRLRAIDAYLIYAGPSIPLTVNGRATVITTWYPSGAEVDLTALSRRMDKMRQGLGG